MLRKLENQYVYLLSCVNLDGYNLPKKQSDMTRKEVVIALQNITKRELQTDVLTQKDLTSWLSGLPASINIDYSFVDIEARLLSFGFKKVNDKHINNWFGVMSYRLLQMFEALSNKKSWFYDK